MVLDSGNGAYEVQSEDLTSASILREKEERLTAAAIEQPREISFQVSSWFLFSPAQML